MPVKKKLLFLHHYGLIGGAGISGGQVLSAIPRDLFDVTVYCNTAAGTQMADHYRSLGFPVIEGGASPQIYAHYSGAEKPLLSRRSIQTLLLVLRDRKRICALLDRERPDVVVVNSMTLFWVGKLAKARGMTCVCFFRETYAREWTGIRNAVIRRDLSRYFDFISFISTHDMDCNRRLRCEKAVICDSVDVSRFAALNRGEARRRLDIPAEERCALYVGGLSKVKGAHVALAAMEQVKTQNACLLFADGEALTADPPRPSGLLPRLRYACRLPNLRRCQRLYRTLKARGRIRVFPLQADIAPLFAAADALLAPSTRPHQLRPVYEAGARGIPVVTTAFAEIAEFANDSNALVVQNGDTAGFAKALDAALGGGAAVAARVERNRAMVRAHNSETTVAEELCALFCRVYDSLPNRSGEAET